MQNRDWRGRFLRGHKAWNKGTKGICKANKTSFKKGKLPPTTLPVGTIIRRKSGNGGRDKRPRNWIKIAQPNKWMLYTRYSWAKKYGHIKKGDIIFLIDGDTLNDDIDNLIAIPRTKQTKYNRWKKPLTTEEIRFFKTRYKKRKTA